MLAISIPKCIRSLTLFLGVLPTIRRYLCINTFSLQSCRTEKLSIVSWNVNGIRSLLKHDKEGKVLQDLVNRRNVDILCLQETKLQECHTADIEIELMKILPLKKAYWSCSTARKGYSGTATLILNSDYLDSSMRNGVNDSNGDKEGRCQTLETKNFFIVNVYVPNSGAELKKLDYRTNIWDTALSDYILSLHEKSPEKSIILAGDLNVAHESLDYYNPSDPRTKKHAGTTPQEQESFKEKLLSKANFIDTFRAVYPSTSMYSYFSARLGDTGRRNKLGMRIDYILIKFGHSKEGALYRPPGDFNDMIVSPPFIEDELSHPFSDHCPVGISIKSLPCNL